MAISYRRPAVSASICKDGAAPHSAPVTGDTRLYPSYGSKKLLDLFRNKMRALRYALSSEKAYRHRIVEFLHFHRAGGGWRPDHRRGRGHQDDVLQASNTAASSKA